jgi:hypothetical protein
MVMLWDGYGHGLLQFRSSAAKGGEAGLAVDQIVDVGLHDWTVPTLGMYP